MYTGSNDEMKRIVNLMLAELKITEDMKFVIQEWRSLLDAWCWQTDQRLRSI